ncbi:hypothetical protein FB639_003648, partial [Coemansia asiatica]
MEEDSHLEHLQDLQSRIDEWQPWTRTLAEVSDNLGVDPSRGLDRLEAYNRHGRFGPNIPVDLGHQLSIFSVLIEESTEPMMLLLLSVGALYSLWGEPWDAATIFVAIAAVIGLEAFTEWRAKSALASLRNSVPTNTTVLRDGCETVAAADNLVIGDVIMLSHGQSVPADAVIAVCHGFAVDESILTGESMGVYKVALGSAARDMFTDDNRQYHESNSNGNNGASEQQFGGSNINSRSNDDDETDNWIPHSLVCAGTTVSAGRAVCIVVATGTQTRIASSIAALMRGTKPPPTPLQLRMGRLASTLSVVAICICTAVTGIGLVQGMEWRRALIMGMSLAFATIPEEMPLIAKASLALGSRSLARHKLLVRKLAAADALSSVSVIVTDKTGTLTRNQLVVSSILAVGSKDPDGTVSARTRSAAEPPKSYLSRAVAVGNSDAEQALSETETESSFPQDIAAPKHWTVIKGAPETLLPRCTRVWKSASTGVVSLTGESIASGTVDGIGTLTASFMQTLTRSATDIAVGGSRLIAYAIAITDSPLFCESETTTTTAAAAAAAASGSPVATLDVARQGKSAISVLPMDLIFVGAFAFYDPPQREARPVIQECQDAGIRVILATGDHPSTALAVASAVGISERPHYQPGYNAIGPGPNPLSAAGASSLTVGSSSPAPLQSASEVHAITGEMVQRSLASNEFMQLIDESNVFARVTPAQKLRLVHALQSRGETVAFIGDGINDAPSLMRADVGICMGGNPSTADVAMDSASLVVLSGRFSGV